MLQVRAIAYDTQQRAIGEVMESGPFRAYLRPLGGGTEWHAPHAHLRPATDAEAAARATTSGSRP